MSWLEYVDLGASTLLLAVATASLVDQIRERRSKIAAQVAERLRAPKPPCIAGDEKCDGYGSAHP